MRSTNVRIWIPFLLIFLFGTSNYTTAQNTSANSHPEKLPWVKGEFPRGKGNFEYMVSHGEGNSIKDARNDSFNSLLIELGNAAGISVNSKTLGEIKRKLEYKNDSSNYEESESSITNYKIDRESFKANFSKVDEYYEVVSSGNGYTYQLWELYEVSSEGGEFKAILPEYTTNYGFNPVCRSVLIPGWGQFYKKKTTKGIAILGTEALLVTGLVYCEMNRSDNYRKSQESTNMTIVKEYRKRADAWELRRNIMIGGAASVYVYNLLDAALAKGKLKYAWIPQNLDLVASSNGGINSYGIAFNF